MKVVVNSKTKGTALISSLQSQYWDKGRFSPDIPVPNETLHIGVDP